MTLVTRQGKGSKLTIQEMDGNLTYLESIAQEGRLEGNNYVYVTANGTDIENAQELQAAYDIAGGLSPDSNNRITIVAAPGYYNFNTGTFEMDTPYIDLVSLDGNRSIIFNAALNTGNRTQGSISIRANDVFVKGVNVLTKNFTIDTNLNLLKVENCEGGDFSFGGDETFGSNPINVSGAFINCQGGDNSFGCGGESSGLFKNCQGGDASFGGLGESSGTLIDCEGGNLSFGGGVTASGIFNNCQGGDNSFGGGGGEASGLFKNCQGGEYSFGGDGILSGKLYYCRLTTGSFNTPVNNSVVVLGIDGDNNVVNLTS